MANKLKHVTLKRGIFYSWSSVHVIRSLQTHICAILSENWKITQDCN